MHTTFVPFGDETIPVIHNGDWSGEVRILGPGNTETRIDGELLIAISKAAAIDFVRDKVTEVLEQL